MILILSFVLNVKFQRLLNISLNLVQSSRILFSKNLSKVFLRPISAHCWSPLILEIIDSVITERLRADVELKNEANAKNKDLEKNV